MIEYVQQDLQETAFEELPVWLQRPLNSAVAALPEIVGAVLILAIGWIAGRLIGGIVSGAVNRMGMDRRVLDTPLGNIMGGSKHSVSRTLGKIAKWFIYALAILAAANLLAIPTLSQWISAALTYLPTFVAGLLIILVGFVLADFIGDMIQRTEAATRTRYTKWFADGVRMFLYFTVLVIGLDTIGIDVTLLYIFARALSWGLAAGIALAIGIGFGWGAKDYIAENMDRWIEKTKDRSST